MPIRLLDPAVASQIAAGEVVERPASVVKELLENAIDSGARQISIRVEAAGQRLIEVEDDGSGISADELALAVSRHATSKLSSSEDLQHIRTLGFRGEALASISSVSRLTITSRSSQESVGARLRVEGGEAEPVEPVGTPAGTAVRVEDLFYNVPARLKFLKTDLTERRQIDELVTRYALAYPQVRFQLWQEQNPVLQTSGNGDRREVLVALYGLEVARQMLELLAEYDDIHLTGFISPLSLTRSNRREIVFFLNGRWIQDPALASALIQAYHTLLMVGRYPQATLFIEMPPELVDVNVHPAKAEVRFRDRDAAFSAVQRAVRRALLAYKPVPGLQPTYQENLAFDQAQAASRSQDFDWNTLPDESVPQQETARQEPGEADQMVTAQAQLAPGRVPILRLVGQVASAYLAAEGPDGLYLIDQHAAHERVLFERFLSQRNSERIPSQSLLEPVAVEFAPAASRLLEEQLPTLGRLGFQVEAFGMNTYLVRAIPALLAGKDPAEALRALVENFEEDETPLQGEIEARLIARVCKRAAVKAGQNLSIEEQRALLADLEACESPRTCPHGRPTMIHLSVDLLERQFGRRGAR
jgi:DNA mismatch repair protein MutL